MSDKQVQEPQIVYVNQPLERDRDELEIDMGRIVSLFWEQRVFAGKLSCGLAALFLGASFLWPKTYESTTVVQTAQVANNLSSSALQAMASLGGSSGNAVVDNYIALMKSRAVIDPIVESMEYEDGMFSTAEDKKAHALANSSKWAEKNIKIENTKGTNLISITATGKTPEQAQEISQAVADNFLNMQTDLNQKQQSLLLKFLDERTKVAYEESVEAGRKFAEYRKLHMIYTPEEQARIAVNRMDAYKNTLADLKTKQQATQAELATASQQLADLNMKSQTYQINDNDTVQNLRQQIANKEVALVALHAKYTEEHPDVKNGKRELAQLRSNLAKEVNAIVRSETASMSPQQAALISKKLNAEVSLKVAQVSEQAVQEKYTSEQKKLEDFPEAVRAYAELKMDADMKQTIYTNLVSNAENAKIQEAKDSMDIQIVDPANLPLEDMPTSPKKGRNAAIGFVLGIIVTMGIAIKKYWQEVRQGNVQ